MVFPYGSRIHAALSKCAGDDAVRGRVAAVVATTWQDIAGALTPIVGQRGVVALYKRSLYLTADKYPWLTGAHDGADAVMNLESLNAVIQRQNAVDAAAAGSALFRTFGELLASLIGSSLAERLLSDAWEKLIRGAPGQEPPT
jgi:hypothetical protein